VASATLARPFRHVGAPLVPSYPAVPANGDTSRESEDPVAVSHCPSGSPTAQPSSSGGVRAISASSHKRHNPFKIQQLWWGRTNPWKKAVIDQAALWRVDALAGIPGICGQRH